MVWAFLKHWRFFAMLGFMGIMFALGWNVHGWKLGYEFNQAEYIRQENFRLAMENNAKWVNNVNAKTMAREKELQSELTRVREESEELRHEIQNRPVIRQVVREAVVGADGVATCPAVPSVDWRVFQDFYNRAATGGIGETPAAGGSNGTLPSDAADPQGGSGTDLADRSF
jgi:hypothetical protein